MNISLIADILGILAGIGFLILTPFKIYSFYRNKIDLINKALLEEGDRLDFLVSNASNSAKRADIYFYLTLEYVELQNEKTRDQISGVLVTTVSAIMCLFPIWFVIAFGVGLDIFNDLAIAISSLAALSGFILSLSLHLAVMKLRKTQLISYKKKIYEKVSKHENTLQG